MRAPAAVLGAWVRSLAILAMVGMAGGGRAQPAPCVAAAEVAPLHLYGLWRAQFEGLAEGATLLFERHREYAESLAGGITRGGRQARVAGDLDAGAFTLEESEDGQRISATWSGQVVNESCGKEIRGTWTDSNNSRTHDFVLRKVPGWQ